MTIFHTSPHNGQAERCRARNICPYGATYGTSILRDGTVKTGTGGSTWTVMKNPPQRAEERIVIDSDGTAKNIWDVENRKLRTSTNTSPAATEESSPMIEKDSATEEPWEVRIGNRITGIIMKDGYPIETVEYGSYSLGPDHSLVVHNTNNEYNYNRVGRRYRDLLTSHGPSDAIFALSPYEEAQQDSLELAEHVTPILNSEMVNPTREEYENWVNTKPDPMSLDVNSMHIYNEPLTVEEVQKRFMSEWTHLQYENETESLYTEDQLQYWDAYSQVWNPLGYTEKKMLMKRRRAEKKALKNNS